MFSFFGRLAGEGPAQGYPELPEVVESLGFGCAQLKTALLGGGVYLADGVGIMIFSSIAMEVSDEFSLDRVQRGFLMTLVFVGIFAGNLLSGPIADKFGRRPIIVASLFFSWLSLVSNSVVVGYVATCVFRLVVGFSFGLGQPPWLALSAEVTPMNWRIVMQSAATFGVFTCGEIYVTFLVWSNDPSMKNLDWRWLIRMASIPIALWALANYYFLPESPAYLAVHGRDREAREALENIRSANFVSEDVSLHFRPLDSAARASRPFFSRTYQQLRMIFSGEYCLTTVILLYSFFAVNVAFYGGLYGFVQVLPDALGTGQSAAFELLVGCLWEFPGELLGMAPLHRTTMLKSYTGLAAVSFATFLFGVEFHYPLVMYIGFYIARLVTTMGMVVLIVYISEVYPTETRAFGTAFGMAGGRLGAVISPVVFELCKDLFGGPFTFFSTLAVLLAFNFLLVGFLDKDMTGKALVDTYDGSDAEEEEEQEPPKKVNDAAASGFDGDAFLLGGH